MGAAIPHLVQLSLALPPILPFPPDDIHMEVLTGTVEVQDEIIPDDEDEDVSYQTRGKSTLSIVIKIGDGKDEIKRAGNNCGAAGDQPRKGGKGEERLGHEDKKGKGKMRQDSPEQIIMQEPEQDDLDFA
jgi:ribonuclease P/MRP protein subunit RPP20